MARPTPSRSANRYFDPPGGEHHGTAGQSLNASERDTRRACLLSILHLSIIDCERREAAMARLQVGGFRRE
jgi:hypothetical protein